MVGFILLFVELCDYVAPELNIQHDLNQQSYNTTNNIEWNQTLTPSYLLRCWTPHAAAHNLYSWRWTYRCPKHVEIFMIINHNCCIKLVPLVIFIYDARSHLHQIRYIFSFVIFLNTPPVLRTVMLRWSAGLQVLKANELGLMVLLFSHLSWRSETKNH